MDILFWFSFNGEICEQILRTHFFTESTANILLINNKNLFDLKEKIRINK